MLVRALLLLLASAGAHGACQGTVYLTIDTGTMEPAERMAEILRRHEVKATFFLANERTARGDTALDPAWAPFWRRLADEGHEFGSHTWRHWYIRGASAKGVAYVAWGAKTGETLDREAFCTELRKPEEAFRAMTGRSFAAIWRAPGGRTNARALEFARECGFRHHIGWSEAGFSGDELPSEKHPGQALIARQLRDIRDGDVLLWHLGIRSRRDPLWPRLEELLSGLKAKGFCFARITEGAAWKR